jgi:hypothetical protein
MNSLVPMSRPVEGASAVPTSSSPPRLRRSAVPKHEPRAASRVLSWEQAATTTHTQGTLALALPDDVAATTDDGQLPAATADPATEQSGRTGLLPEPKAWAGTFIQAAMEVAGGLRSAGQLVRWTTPEVHALLVRRGALTARARRGITLSSKPRVRALIACAPRPGVCEVSAVIAEPERVRAVAFRMEGLHGRWRVTELEIG